MEQQLSRTVYWVVTSWSGSVWADRTGARVSGQTATSRAALHSQMSAARVLDWKDTHQCT